MFCMGNPCSHEATGVLVVVRTLIMGMEKPCIHTGLQIGRLLKKCKFCVIEYLYSRIGEEFTLVCGSLLIQYAHKAKAYLQYQKRNAKILAVLNYLLPRIKVQK